MSIIFIYFLKIILYNMSYNLCLNMIVKNESEIIEDLLNSLYKFIDYYVISDTGSTDNTKEVIKNFFDSKNIPGEIYDDKWINFGYNRTLAFEHAFNKSKYVIVMDADDVIDGDIVIPEDDNDGYYIKFILSDSNQICYRPQIFKNNIEWMYKGIIHENVCSKNNVPIRYGKLENFHVLYRNKGYRSKDKNTIKNDMKLLLKGIELNDDYYNVYLYHLIKCYIGTKDYTNAIRHIKKFIGLNLKSDQTYDCYIKLGIIMNELKYSDDKIINAYNNALTIDNISLEAYYHLSYTYFTLKEYEKAYNIISIPTSFDIPTFRNTFIDHNIYNYMFNFLKFDICLKLDKYDEAYNVIKKVLLFKNDKDYNLLNIQNDTKYKLFESIIIHKKYDNTNDVHNELYNNVKNLYYDKYDAHMNEDLPDNYLISINLEEDNDNYDGFSNHEGFSNYDLINYVVITNEIVKLFEYNYYHSLKSITHLNITHYNIWLNLLNDDRYDFYVVTDSKTKLSDDFIDKVNDIISNLTQENEFIYLGYSMLENVKKIYHLEKEGVNKINKNLISSCNGSYIISKLGAMKLVNYIINNGIKIPILEIPLYLNFMNIYDHNPHLVKVPYEDNFVKFYQDNIENKNLINQYYFKEENVKIFDDDIYIRASNHYNKVLNLNHSISNNLNLLNNISKLL